MWEILKNTEFNPFLGCSFAKVLQNNKIKVISQKHFNYLMNGRKRKGKARGINQKPNLDPDNFQTLDSGYDRRNINTTGGCKGTPYCDCYKTNHPIDGSFISYEDRDRISFLDYLDHCIFEMATVDKNGPQKRNPVELENGCSGTPYCECGYKLSKKQTIRNRFDLLNSVQDRIIENNKLKCDIQKLRSPQYDPKLDAIEVAEDVIGRQTCTCLEEQSLLNTLNHLNDSILPARKPRSIFTKPATVSDIDQNDSALQFYTEPRMFLCGVQPDEPCGYFKFSDDGENSPNGTLGLVEGEFELKVPYTATLCPGSVFCDCYRKTTSPFSTLTCTHYSDKD